MLSQSEPDRLEDVNSPSFWEDVYQRGEAGWDIGGPTPVFRRLLESKQFAPGTIIVLGAGRGHDAREFARQGFTVTAVDFAAQAARDMRALAEPDAPVEILQADIFDLPPALDGAFDYALEYVCFCAIPPRRRAEYADVVTRLLKPGSVFIVLAFPLEIRDGGPPFAVSSGEFLSLFRARGFTLLHREFPPDSIQPRRRREELLIFQKDTFSCPASNRSSLPVSF